MQLTKLSKENQKIQTQIKKMEGVVMAAQRQQQINAEELQRKTKGYQELEQVRSRVKLSLKN
jgi:hypothetical protein